MRRFLHAWWPVAVVVLFTTTLVLQIPRKALFFRPVSVDPVEPFVSFISLELVIPPLLSVMSGDAEVVCLIKPQFEAGRENVGKKGVVRSKDVHRQVVEKIVSFVRSLGCAVLGLDYSPIKGPKGNISMLSVS